MGNDFTIELPKHISAKHKSANTLLNRYQFIALVKLKKSPTWAKSKNATAFTDFINIFVKKDLITMIIENDIETENMLNMLAALRVISKLKDKDVELAADKQIIYTMMHEMLKLVTEFFNSEPDTDKAKTTEIYNNIDLIKNELDKIEGIQINKFKRQEELKIKRQEELKTAEEFDEMITARLALLPAPSVPKGEPGAASAVQKYLKYAINSEGINQPSIDKDANHLYIKYKQKYLELKKQVDNSIFN